MSYYRAPTVTLRIAVRLKRFLPTSLRIRTFDAQNRLKKFLLMEPPIIGPLFYYPGWMRIASWQSFLGHRGNEVPWRHAVALDALKSLDNFHRSIGAVTLLKDGALLGAVRQGAFAGRPGDLDVAVVSPVPVEEYLSALRREKYHYKLKELAHKYNRLGPAKLYLRSGIRIDIRLCHYEPEKPGFLVEQNNNIDQSSWVYEWPGRRQALTATLHGEAFYIPENYEDILGQHYGPSWRVATTRQVALRTVTLRRATV